MIATCFENLGDTCRAAGAAVRDQRGVSIALAAQRILAGLLCTVALLVQRGVVAAALAFAIATMIGAGMHVTPLRRAGVHFVRSAVKPAQLRRFLPGTTVLGLNNAVLTSLFRLDAVLLGLMQNDVAVATYAVAYRLLDTVLFVAQNVRQTLVPVMAAALFSETGPIGVRRPLEAGWTFCAMVYAPFAAVCLTNASPLISLLFGDTYSEASRSSLQWLAPVPLLYALGFLVTGAFQAAGRNSAMLWCSATATVVNVALNLVLIPSYSGAGAAAATTASYAVNLALALMLLSAAGVRPRLARSLAAALAGAGAAGASMAALALPLLPELCIAGGVYVLVWSLLFAVGGGHRELLTILRPR